MILSKNEKLGELYDSNHVLSIRNAVDVNYVEIKGKCLRL